MQKIVSKVYCVDYEWNPSVFVGVSLVRVFFCYLYSLSHLLETASSHYSATVNPWNEFSLWQFFAGDMLNPLSKRSLYITRFFPQESFYLPALISDSLRPLSSSAGDITLLFLLSEGYYTQRNCLSSVLLHTHSWVCAGRSKPLSYTHSLYSLNPDCDPTTLPCTCSAE